MLYIENLPAKLSVSVFILVGVIIYLFILLVFTALKRSRGQQLKQPMGERFVRVSDISGRMEKVGLYRYTGTYYSSAYSPHYLCQLECTLRCKRGPCM